MSGLGLGRVKTTLEEAGSECREPGVIDRSDQRLGSDDVHDPCQSIGQNRKSHFSGYFWKRFGEEVCCGPSSCRTDVRRSLDVGA